MSIGRKFAFWIAAILLVVGTATVSLFYFVELREEAERLGMFGRLAGSVIEEGLVPYMQRRDQSGLNEKLESLKKSAESISRILLLNKDGVVKAGTDKGLLGKKFSVRDAGCRECHDKGRQGLLLGGGGLYRWAAPLANITACQACHPASAKINGVLIIDFTVAEFQRHVREEIAAGFLIFISAMAAIGLILVFLSRALVTRRLVRLGAAMKHFQEGDTAVRAPAEGGDEVAQLETGFNELAQAIAAREREKNGLLAGLHAANDELQREIAGRKHWEQALGEQKAFAENMIQNSAVATFVVDPHHRVVFWNSACEELTGVRAADMIGTSDQWKPFYAGKRQTLSDVVIDGNTESLSALYEKHARSALTADGLHSEGWYKNLNGKDRYIIFDAAPVYDSRGELVVAIETLQDVTAQKQMEDALAVSENRLRTIIDTEPECVKLIAADGTVLEMNPAGLAMLEADSPDQVVGKAVLSHIAPEYHDAVRAHSESVFAGASGTIEFEVIGLKGTRRCLESRTAPIRDTQGKIYALLGVTRDITDRKRWERTLEEQLHFLQLLIDTIPMPVFYKDVHGVYRGCNEAFEELIGLPKDRLIGKTVYDIAPGELADKYDRMDRELFDRPGVQVYEYSVRRADGTVREVIFNKATYTDAEGKVAGLVGAMQDITERKRLEQKLAQSEGHLRAIIDTEPECVKVVAADGTLLEINPAGLAMLEADSFEQVAGLSICPFVASEYRPEFEALSEKAFRGESGMLEFEIVGLKGTRRWLETHTAPLRNARGEIFALLGVTRDITGRKGTEMALRESEDKFRQVVASATDAIMVFDLETRRFVEVNKAAEEIYGYSREEWLNMRQDAIPADADKEAADAFIGEVESSKKPLVVPLRYHRKKDGTIFPVEISSSVFMANGRQLVCGVIRDITERNKAAEAIKRNYDSQTAINWVLHISLEDIPLDSILKQTLDLLLSIPWISFEARGSIFLVEGVPGKLVMKVQRGLSDRHREACAIVPLGTCLCGLAAARAEVLFAGALDGRHEVRYDGMAPHGHYCVPIKQAATVLGVINIYLKEGHKRDQQEIDFLNAIASALAGIIHRKRIEEERETLIGDLRNVLESVSRSRKEWRDTFDSITDMISIVDKDFTILKTNKAFSAYYGLLPPQAINKKYYELVHDGAAPMENRPRQTTVADDKPSGEEVFDRQTKRTFRIFTFPYLSPEGENIGSIHVMRDITDDKEKEMRLIASERLAALGQMASGIAHEINNPLASIAGCSEGLLLRLKKGRCDSPLFESYLSIIQEEVFRCKSITTAMLSFVRKTTYEKKELNVAGAIDKTLEIIGFQGRLKNIDVQRRYRDPAMTIHGNEGELRQVLLSVITNAFDAMNDKGALTVETEAWDGGAVIRVCDSGEGIPPEVIERIFDPFFTTKAERGGTGLGLSIARKIVSNHDGRIEASTSAGKGTTITITLPR